MSALPVHDVLKHEIDLLPDDLAEEVFDFVLFVKARRTEEEFLWRQVEETLAYRQEQPQDIITATAEEWAQSTAHLQDAP